MPLFTGINDDGTLPHGYDAETNDVSLNGTVRLLALPDPIPELAADAELADVIAMLITLGICTQAEAE